MLDNLTTRLARIVKTIRGEARLTEANIQEALREVRVALLEADVALPVVKHFIESVRAAALGAEVVGSLTPGQALVGVVHRELAKLMGEANVGLDLATQPPAVILMAGLQGSGKTTTTGLIARLPANDRKKVAVVSADVYRPAAIEQLKTVAGQAGVKFIPSATDQKPIDIAKAALDYA
jgi:signal recognition particle subunit SRP54